MFVLTSHKPKLGSLSYSNTLGCLFPSSMVLYLPSESGPGCFLMEASWRILLVNTHDFSLSTLVSLGTPPLTGMGSPALVSSAQLIG